MRSVAFLRAVNVGGRVVKMDRLRAIFEGAGLGNVETFIASGNVIFDARAGKRDALEAKVERALEQALGYEVTTFIRSVSEVAAVAAYAPFAGVVAGDTLFVGFVKREPEAAVARKIVNLSTAADLFEVHGTEVYWLRRKGSETVFSGAVLEKTLGAAVTVRNLTTIRKLVAKYELGR